MKRREPLLLAAICLTGAVITGWSPRDRTIWLLEAGPVLVALPLLMIAGRRFPLTDLSYRLLLFFALILLVGGHYSYARVPAGNWVRDAFGLTRNHYDRFGHLFQGIVPAIVFREVLVRWGPLRPGAWLVLVTTSMCLALSALYELFEWFVAVLGGSEVSAAFLAGQGDPWDTQWDMLLALVGALLAL
ncbi:MAG: DUF2238 domain-containing protein, partial [Deltaproteobacteria bacterium]|nr:DUF2238 domain-containing protein [Candidatus Anaeroferrophillacea bacterium]